MTAKKPSGKKPTEKKPPGYDPEWVKAKKICRLNQEEIQMAKELGLKPKSLMKNNPSPNQPWKAPVKVWIRDLHENRFGPRPSTIPHTTSAEKPKPSTEQFFDDPPDPAKYYNDDIPF